MNRILFVITVVVYAFSGSAWAGNCGAADGVGLMQYEWSYAPHGKVKFSAANCSYENENNASPKYSGAGKFSNATLTGNANSKRGAFDLTITKAEGSGDGPAAASYKCTSEWGKSDVLVSRKEKKNVKGTDGNMETVDVDVVYKTGEIYTFNMDCGGFTQYLYREVPMNPPVLAQAN